MYGREWVEYNETPSQWFAGQVRELHVRTMRDAREQFAAIEIGGRDFETRRMLRQAIGHAGDMMSREWRNSAYTFRAFSKGFSPSLAMALDFGS